VLRVGAIVPVTEAEGPGRRFALWVQGCSIRCPGCCNPQLFEAMGGREDSVDALVARLREVAAQVEGVTLLGGEPFDQAGPLSQFAEAARGLGLSVMTFSGYALEELRAMGSDAAALLAATDLLVDGRYDANRPELERRWAGSANQRFHFLTDRYAPGVERPAEGGPLRTVEVTLTFSELRANGWPALGRRG
jgi:anaerobic ribonucleoside-triphosphate reductase activating protein